MGLFNFLEKTIPITSQSGETVYINIPASLYYKEMAIFSAITLIGNALSRSEVKCYVDGKEVRNHDYYLLNVSPNPNQTSSQFWQRIVKKMFNSNDGTCLVFPRSDNLYIADSYMKTEFGDLKGHKYGQITLGQIQINKTFKADDIYLFYMYDDGIRRVLDSVCNEYSKILTSAVDVFKSGNGRKYKLKIDASETGSPDFQENFKNNISKQLKTFLESNSAVYPEFDGYELVADTSTTKGNSDDIVKIRKDMFEMVSKAFKIPVSLLEGDSNDMENVMDEFLTFAVDPVADMISECLNKCAGWENFEKGNYYRVDTSGIYHRDVFKLSDSIDKLISSGTYSINDVLKQLGQEQLQEDWAEQHWITKNYSKIENMMKGVDSDE